MTKKGIIELLQLTLNDTVSEMESLLGSNDGFSIGEFTRLSNIADSLTNILEDIKQQEIMEMFYKGLSPRQILLAQNIVALDGLRFCNKASIMSLKRYVVNKCDEFEHPTRTLDDYYRYFDDYGLVTVIVDGVAL